MTKILTFALFCVLSGCAASNEILPKAGNALLAAKDSYEQVEQARVALETVYSDLCAPDGLPFLVQNGTCPKVRQALDGVKAGTVAAAEALNVAISAYTEVNNLVGAP